MNDLNLMGQISNRLLKGRFAARAIYQDSGEKKRLGVPELIRLSMKKNISPPMVSKQALDKAMKKSMDRYINGAFTLPDMILRATSTAKARNILAKYAPKSQTFTRGKAVLATIKGENHTLWQDSVLRILNGLGYHTIDLGSNVSLEDVVRSVKKEEPDLLGIVPPATSLIPEFNAMSSISLTQEMKGVVDMLEDAGCRDHVTILIGGDVTGNFSADEVGVDYYCGNLLQTVELLRKLAYPSSASYSGAHSPH